MWLHRDVMMVQAEPCLCARWHVHTQTAAWEEVLLRFIDEFQNMVRSPICCCTWESFYLGVVLNRVCLFAVSVGTRLHDFLTNKSRLRAMLIEWRNWRCLVDVIMFASVTKNFTLLAMVLSSIILLLTWAKLSAVWLCGKYCTPNNCKFSLM